MFETGSRRSLLDYRPCRSLALGRLRELYSDLSDFPAPKPLSECSIRHCCVSQLRPYNAAAGDAVACDVSQKAGICTVKSGCCIA